MLDFPKCLQCLTLESRVNGLIQFFSKIPCGETFLAAADFLGGAHGYNIAAAVASVGTHVYDMVGTLDYLKVVLDDDYGVSARDEGVEGLKELLYVVEMKASGRLVEDEHRGDYLLQTYEVCQFHALVLSARQCG